MTIEPMLTNDGISLLLRAISGEQITFTRFACGKGAAPSNPAALTDLVNRVMYFGIDSSDDAESGYITITGSFDSSDVQTDFQWTETGLYCKDANNVEKLYAYCHYGTGTEIPANDSVLTEQQVTLIVAIGEAEHVTVRVNPSALYASKEDFDAHVAAANPHGTTKADVGLGKVPNVSTNNQTPTYTAAEAPAELASGEKLSVAFGKLKAAVTALIAHLASRNNPHAVTAAQAGAAAAVHTHGASDINSGVLSVARGGTGAGTAAQAANTLGFPRIKRYSTYGSGAELTFRFDDFEPKLIIVTSRTTASANNPYLLETIFHPTINTTQRVLLLGGAVAEVTVSEHTEGSSKYWTITVSAELSGSTTYYKYTMFSQG